MYEKLYIVGYSYPHGTRSLGYHLYWGMSTNVSFIKEMTQIRWLFLSRPTFIDLCSRSSLEVVCIYDNKFVLLAFAHLLF